MDVIRHVAVIMEDYSVFKKTGDEVIAEYKRRLALREQDVDGNEDIGLVDEDWPADWPTEGRDHVRTLLGGVAFNHDFCPSGGKDCICLIRIEGLTMRVMEIW